MNLINQKLFIPYETLVIPPRLPKTKKNICFYFYGENVTFLDTYNFLNFKKQYARHVYVPTMIRPRSYLTPEYMRQLKERKLFPVKGLQGDYTKVQGYNFFYDATRYLNSVDLFYKVSRFDAGMGSKLYNNYLNSAAEIDPNAFERILLYAINIDKPVPNKLMRKKCYIFFMMLFNLFNEKIESIPFDKIIMFVYNKDGGRFVKLYDVEAKNNNFIRVKNILMNLQQQTDPNTIKNNEIEDATKIASKESKLVNKNNEEIIKSAIKTYANSTTSAEVNDDIEDHDKLVTKSVVYNVVGDNDIADKLSKKIDKKPIEKRAEIINKLTSQLISRPPAKNFSSNIFVKIADAPKLVDYQSPEHILQKRKDDFRLQLRSDVQDAFKMLENKDVPLKLKKLDIKEVHTGPSEIYKTIKNRFLVELTDTEGNVHDVHVDFPHLTDDGTFMVNGQNKVLINQLLRFPIFYPSVNVGRFESSYSIMKIHSKFLQNGAYLIGYLGSYKFPILMLLAYKYGLREALKDYGVTYTIN